MVRWVISKPPLIEAKRWANNQLASSRPARRGAPGREDDDDVKVCFDFRAVI